MAEEELLEFDDDAAISFILNYLPDNLKTVFDDDDIQYLLDVIYDFYDSKGYLDEDVVEEVDIDEEELFNYVLKCAKKDKIANFSPENVQILLDAEYEYSKSIGIFND